MRPPHPPGDKPGELESKHHRDTRATADRRQLSESRKNEWLQRTTHNRGFDVLRRPYRLSQTVLSGWRKKFARFVTIRNSCAITRGP